MGLKDRRELQLTSISISRAGKRGEGNSFMESQGNQSNKQPTKIPVFHSLHTNCRELVLSEDHTDFSDEDPNVIPENQRLGT